MSVNNKVNSLRNQLARLMVFKAQVRGSPKDLLTRQTVFPWCTTTGLCMYYVTLITCHGIETKLTLLVCISSLVFCCIAL